MSPEAPPPTDLRHADVACVVALPFEVAPLLARCQHLHKYSGGPFIFRGGKYGSVRLAAVECGMGASRAERGTRALIDAHSPRWILSIGLSGALCPALRVGDIVVGTSLSDRHGNRLNIPFEMPEDRQRGLYVGGLLMSDTLVRTVAEKRTLFDQTGALAVDLESLAVARVCRDTQTRFMAVRVISDDCSADLPAEILTILGGTGAIRWGATLGALWNRPQSMSELWKLREKSHLAAQKLADFLDGILAQLPLTD